MAASQLKQLKASLREGGILGPQKSKKQRKTNGRDASARQKRNAALEGIREKFNPFEVKAPSRTPKFDISSNKPSKKVVERPAVTRGLGEERRRATLLKELQSRNKVGSMNDRRFGEDDPNMTPEQKAAERFARQAMRVGRKNDMFNLEEDGDDELTLTHGGRALDFDGKVKAVKPLQNDFEESVSGSESEDFDAADDRPRKRLRLDEVEAAADAEEDDQEVITERRKTKKEVMQEVMAKSKAYKAARQAQKEDDEDLRAELDQGLGDIFAALTQQKPKGRQQLPSPPVTDSEPSIDPSRAAMLAGKSREEAEKDYEANVRQMALEARSKPTFKTKTDEQKAAEEKARLEELERERLRRMRGEPESSDDEDAADGVEIDALDDDQDDAEAFGLEQPQPKYAPQLEVEDEDEFVMDDILASDSEADLASDFEDNDSTTLEGAEDDGDDDFINGLVLPQQPERAEEISRGGADSSPFSKGSPFTFPCPQDLAELKRVTLRIPADELPVVVQRIRALYHKGLAEGNNEKLGKFAQALVFWIADLVNDECEQKPSMQIVEQLIRHLHSMAKEQPLEVALAFRERFRGIIEQDKEIPPGDLTLLTAISTIFPTSDQWHPVVTPAMLIMTRYLAQIQITNKVELATGIFVSSLLLRYQTRSSRYVPEVINYLCRALRLLAPMRSKSSLNQTSSAQEEGILRIVKKESTSPSSKLSFMDLRSMVNATGSSAMTSESLLLGLLNLCIPIIDLYGMKTAFPEMCAPLRKILNNLSHSKSLALLHQDTQAAVISLIQAFDTAVITSTESRKPLLLHNHKPLAIKSAYPLFTDNYNPERKQRDPDEERAELNKLRAEHKKERKGAMRELRKDANFMAREQLREKKAKDEAYDKKFKRLVAEIQGEEGREAKQYEREKAKRQGRF